MPGSATRSLEDAAPAHGARRRALAGAMALVALSLAGTSARATGPAPPAPSLRTPPKELLLAAEDDAAPWSYADGSGYVNDLVRAAFEAGGWTVRLKVVPYARCKSMAIKGEVAGCFTVGRTAEVENALLFPQNPVLEARNLLVARAALDSAWTGCVAAAWGLVPRVGLVRGYEYVPAVEALAPSGAARLDPADSEVANLRKLRLGRIDATVLTLDEVKTSAWLARLAGVPDDTRVVCDFGALPSYVAFSRRHALGEAARAAFDDGYARLQRSGALAALQARWRQRALDRTAGQVKVH